MILLTPAPRIGEKTGFEQTIPVQEGADAIVRQDLQRTPFDRYETALAALLTPSAVAPPALHLVAFVASTTRAAPPQSLIS